MKKVYIVGEESIKTELSELLSGKAEVTGKLNLETDIIIECSIDDITQKAKNIKHFDENCSAAIPVFTSSLCYSVSEQSKFSKYPTRLIGIGLYNTFSKAKLLEIAPSKITDTVIVEKAESFLSEIGFSTAKVPDRVGFVFPRILSMIINEAAQVYSEQIATAKDIDTAMKLGTNYPIGPLEWADKIGIDTIYNILSALQRDFGEDRYRPHPSLKEMINLNQLGVKTNKGFYEW